jgi:hypothetical protein
MRPRFLRNAVDSSPGGGASPPPSSPPAQGAPAGAPAQQTQQTDVDRLVDAIAGRLEKTLTERVNGAVFANARKAGLLGDDKGKGGQQQQAGAPPEASSQTSAQLAPDQVEALIDRRTDLAFELGKAGLNPAQAGLVRSLFDAQKPPEVGPWVATTLATLGLAKQPDSTNQQLGQKGQQQASNIVTTPNPNPASNGGAPGQAEPSFEEQPWLRDDDSVQRLIREKGFARAAFELREAVSRVMPRMRFTF